ncbi:hypothetical protein BCF74_11033 [Knoellia remsis]|uniref:LPXTG-motif cell wall-anchored protein n=1 Tax=Knoellia remsis TaxID=407159 RepID=A0A2T0UN24_9MICO|nr:hypothetical protein [Knoellia remsis]PRY59296.1 hypothetical protein BCF74_11033 [Knoellia remsis]
MSTSFARRVCLGALAVSVVAVGSAAPAQAESTQLKYTCDVFSLKVAGVGLSDLLGQLPLDAGSAEDALEQLRKAAENATPAPTSAPTSAAPSGDATPDATATGPLDAITEQLPGGSAAPTDTPGTTSSAATDPITPILDQLGANLPITAVFDSAIADGATAPANSEVTLDPVTAKIFLTPQINDQIPDAVFPVAIGGLDLYGGVPETDQEINAAIDFDSFGEDGGGVIVSGKGEADEALEVGGPGTYSYEAGDLTLYAINEDDNLAIGIDCALNDGQDATIDTVRVVGAAGSGSGPVRPVVVQTDAAQPTTPSALPYAAVAFGATLVIGGAAGMARRRSAARR